LGASGPFEIIVALDETMQIYSLVGNSETNLERRAGLYIEGDAPWLAIETVLER
jgi:hypothetical protein